MLRGRSPEAWSHLGLCPWSSSRGSSVNPTAKCRQQGRKGKCKTSSRFFLVGGFLSGHSKVKLAHSSSAPGWHRAALPASLLCCPGAHVESASQLNIKFWIFLSISIGSGLALLTQGSDCLTHMPGARSSPSWSCTLPVLGCWARHGARLMISTVTSALQPQQLPDRGRDTFLLTSGAVAAAHIQ